MQAKLEDVLSQLTTAIQDNNLQLCHELSAQFKACFTSELQKKNISAEQLQRLESQLDSYQDLVQVLQEEKKLVASDITKFKRNSAKISKYTQYK
ncbi:hypothetical protein [Pseudoalteromonas sp. P1-9]|uniref:hypothetical protein n=1 Tax=Pseudoalteromonas sp. P1-9 TaxID=1710354 RepID=UPI0006D6043C|nr:hypothetical protein [Pseudoalteromonas sp. P1-9]